jgi:predicted acetyltransferase
MPIEVRTCRDAAEFRAALGAIWQYFGGEPTEEQAENFRRNLPLERMHAAFDAGRLVGGAGSFPLQMTVRGGSVSCAGVTLVGVDPTHRRRGIMTQMMRLQLDEARERGDPIAALWASEASIYGRFGFGLASFSGEVQLPRDRSAFTAPVERLPSRVLSTEEALEAFPRVYNPVAARVPGMYARTPVWWETRVLYDPEDRRRGAGPARCVLLERDGRPVAYAIYRHQQSFEYGVSVGALLVIEAVGVDAAAEAAVWRYLCDVDWVATIKAQLLPLDHPLLLLVADVPRLRFTVGDGVWIRLVDVGAALSTRSYAGEGEIVFEVGDPFAHWNEGRWRLAGGRAERTDAEPDIRLAVTELGAVYLGGVTFGQLARAGRVAELRPGAVTVADGIFRADALPWCPEIF